MDHSPSLVADVGGTHIRFGIVDRPAALPRELRTFTCAEFSSPEAAIAAYLDASGAKPRAACLAVAGPVSDNVCRLTNLSWEISGARLAQRFAFAPALVVNDFAALALGVPHLAPEELISIGGGAALAGQPVAVVGPGTGLGTATLIAVDGNWLALPGEGGHTGLAPMAEPEAEAIRRIRARLGSRLSTEEILSGRGLALLAESFAELGGKRAQELKPADVVEQGLREPPTGVFRQTLECFCELLGSYAGDFALQVGARGGVVIGGGIAPRLLSILGSGGFRARFEDKGPMRAYAAAIPTRIIVAEAVALRGCAAWLEASSRKPKT
jgi:glucokinase